MSQDPYATSTCGCCSGRTARTPGVIANPPGLTEIAYRSGTHGDFLASMIAGLSRLDRPALGRLRTRDPDDPSIALLDAWAVACDILTFYSERLANESYLRTATERISLQELGKLLSYRLSPGAAAESWLAFSLERPTTPPLLVPPDPGLLPPVVSGSVVLPQRLRVQSVPGPGELPQTFETVDEIEARPEWNALPVVRTTPYPPVFGRRSAWLAGTGLTPKPGEAILFASNDLTNDRWDVRIISGIELDVPGGRTRVGWEGGLGSLQPLNHPAQAPEAFVLRKRIAVFGHNAPVWSAMNKEFRTGYVKESGGDADGPNWPGFGARRLEEGKVIVDLDGSYPDVVRGSWVVLTQETGTFHRELYEVLDTAELSRSAFAVSGKVTRLTLHGEDHAFGSTREVTVLAAADPVTVVEAPDESAVDSATIAVHGDAHEMTEGRTLVLSGIAADGTAQSEVVTLKSVTKTPGDRTTIVLTEAPSQAYKRATAVVFGNVARATHGETVHQILGSGDARHPFLTFPLIQEPLTFVPADTSSGVASSLAVEVDGVRWYEKNSTYLAAPPDRVFVTRTGADGKVNVIFGDGLRGARTPTGSHNLRATYRKGIGSLGNVRRDSLSQPLDRPLGLKAVTNPVAATGGVDAEDVSHARTSIPLPVRTLSRAVSLSDYADFALAFTGIAKASAVVLSLRAGRTIVVTVADNDGLPPPGNNLDRLAGELRRKGDPHVRVLVLPARSASFQLAVKVRVNPDRDRDVVLVAVEQALRASYGRPASTLGAAVHQSAVVATAAAVPGVVAVDLDRLYRTGSGSLNDRLLADPSRVGFEGVPLASELLAISDAPFDWLLEMP